MENEIPVSDANERPDLDPDVGLSSSPDGITVKTDSTARPVSTVEEDLGKGQSESAAKPEAEKAEADRIAAKAAEKANAAAETEDGEKETAKTGEKGQEGRFDQHPDWQRMKQERDEALLKAARYEGMLEAGKAKPSAESEAAPDLPFKDVTKLTKEENLEWFEDDPVGYNANLFAQFNYERDQIEAHRRGEQEKRTTVGRTVDSILGENKTEFQNMLKSGELDRYVAANPGTNHLFAFRELTREREIKEASAKAAKEAEARVINNFQAKRNAQVITDTGGALAPASDQPETLKDTSKYGGSVSVIADRLRQMRQQKAAV